MPREGHFLAFVVHGEPRENIRVAECVDYRGSKITVWHYVDVSSGFDLRKPLQVRKLAGEHGAGPDTHGNYRNGIVDPVGQGLRNFYRLEATYNVGGTKGVSTSDEHGTVDIIVDRFMLEVRGKYGYVPPPVCRLVSEWLERPSHKAACSDVPDAEKRELFYTQNMAAANAILPFPRPVLGDGPRRAPRRSGAAPESSSRLRLVDFLGKTSVTLDIAQYATDLGYCTTRDDVPIRQERDTCGFNSARGACIMRMGGADGRWSYTNSVFHAVDDEWVEQGKILLGFDYDDPEQSDWLTETQVGTLISEWNPDQQEDKHPAVLVTRGRSLVVASAPWATVESLDSFLRRIAEDMATKKNIPLHTPSIAVVNLGASNSPGWHWIAAAWCNEP